MAGDIFTQEQLERVVRDARAEIRYIWRKILVELITSSVVLTYVSANLEFRVKWLLIGALLVNIAGWVQCMLMVSKRVFYWFSMAADYSDAGFIDEYRRVTYELARLRRPEALFDALTATQFLLMSMNFAMLLFLR